MKQILSQNEMSSNTLKDFFVPSFAAGFLYSMLGAVLLLIYTFTQILGWFGNDYLDSASKLNQSFHVFNKGLSTSFNSALGGRLGQIIVWSFVGALCYILIWFVKNMFNSVQNDIIVDQYSHPKSYNRVQFFGVALGELVFFIAMLILLAVYTFVGLKIMLPASASLMSASINHFQLPSSVFYIIFSALVPVLGVYIWSIFSKVVVRLWRHL
ncbi:hypothetical protein KW794_00995 [Candidatus Saccharibacteria bacterium]|nr:hypothetical protein [Candidatus Saccharibacteria bacterium]